VSGSVGEPEVPIEQLAQDFVAADDAPERRLWKFPISPQIEQGSSPTVADAASIESPSALSSGGTGGPGDSGPGIPRLAFIAGGTGAVVLLIVGLLVFSGSGPPHRPASVTAASRSTTTLQSQGGATSNPSRSQPSVTSTTSRCSPAAVNCATTTTRVCAVGAVCTTTTTKTTCTAAQAACGPSTTTTNPCQPGVHCGTTTTTARVTTTSTTTTSASSTTTATTTTTPPCLAVTGVSPGQGGPGSTVTITGCGFVGATSVTFAGVPANFSVVNSTTITATAPVGPAQGPAPVQVSTSSGTTPATGPTFLYG
jgi:hypothetical protein